MILFLAYLKKNDSFNVIKFFYSDSLMARMSVALELAGRAG